MARRRKIRKAHPRLFKYLTIFGATIGIVGASAFSVFMAVDAAKGDLIVDTLREYTASFSSEGSVITKGTYKRGDLLEKPENPVHTMDGENNYFFIGWDTNHNGIPDFVPSRAYYSFDAEAVYFKTGKFDLNFLDLLNMDLEDLMKLLQDLNIDWEQFMSMFNIDPETLMQWLMQNAVLTYTTRPSSTEYPVYFRSTSFGDFDYSKKAFNAPSFYDPSLISDNSVNPLSFTSYKVRKLEEMGLLPNGFGFINYDITYSTVEDYYPLPDCAYSDDLNEYGSSDAHYQIEPTENEFSVYSAYCPAFGYVIDMLDMVPLTGTVYRDEKKYYQYALDNYTAVPSEYNDILDDMIIENDWYDEELWQVDSIAAYVSQLGKCSMFNDDGEIDVESYMNSKNLNKDPVLGLLENGRGSDFDFNATATMLFRRLHIPARLVKGYVGFGSSPEGSTITLFNQHYWCEIYVKGTGWMICDCMDTSAITGTNPYAELDKSNTPMENKHILDRITIREPAKLEYQVGEEFNLADGGIRAYFQDGETSNLYFASPGVTVNGFDSSEPGACTITVSYTYEGVTKSDRFIVVIKDANKKLVRVDFELNSAPTWYYVGQAIDTSAITALGRYDDGSTIDLTGAIVSSRTVASKYMGIENYDDSTLSISGSLADDIKDPSKKTATYHYEVYNKRIDSIILDGSPIDKMEYNEGDTFTEKGIHGTVVYYDGSTDSLENVSFGITSYPSEYNMAHAGTYPVTVTCYNEKYDDEDVTATFNIVVNTNDITALTITNYKDTYYVGESFNSYEFFSGATATLSYEHSEDKIVDDFNYISVDTPDLLHAGDKLVTATYSMGEKTKSTSLVVHVISTGGVIGVDYNVSDEMEFDYNGNSHAGSIYATPNLPSNFPSHLTAEIEMIQDGLIDDGTDIDEHHVSPVLHIYAGGYDVTSEYNYVLDDYSGITYYVNPIPITITVGPTSSGPFHVGDNILITATASGVSVTYSYYFIPTSVGSYSNYDISSLVIYNKGVDVTECYDITFNFVKVEVVD